MAALLLTLGLAAALAPAAAASAPRPASRTVDIGGDVLLHYLDWGGAGPPVLLLAGLGDTAYIYSDAAPRLAARFHVLALTRRGYGESDVTPDGYGIDDRVEDIRVFLDKAKIDRAVLVGHSTAGDELTAFATKYPARVAALVYLDAAYDRADPATPAPHMDAWRKVATKVYGGVSEDATYASLHARRAALTRLFRSEYGVAWTAALEQNLKETTVVNADGSLSPRTPPFVGGAIRRGARAQRLDMSAIKAPALLVFARGRLEDQPITFDDPAVLASIKKDEDDYEVYFRAYAQRLKAQNPKLSIEVLPKARHYFFLQDPGRLAELVARAAG
jgi:pimeloyl-ACP methyl ester carboxylesterase